MPPHPTPFALVCTVAACARSPLRLTALTERRRPVRALRGAGARSTVWFAAVHGMPAPLVLPHGCWLPHRDWL